MKTRNARLGAALLTVALAGGLAVAAAAPAQAATIRVMMFSAPTQSGALAKCWAERTAYRQEGLSVGACNYENWVNYNSYLYSLKAWK